MENLKQIIELSKNLSNQMKKSLAPINSLNSHFNELDKTISKLKKPIIEVNKIFPNTCSFSKEIQEIRNNIWKVHNVALSNFKNPFENLKTEIDIFKKYNSILKPLTEYINSINLELYPNKELSKEENEIVYKVINDLSQNFSFEKDIETIENTISNSIQNLTKTLDNPKNVNKSNIFIDIIILILQVLLSFFSDSLISVNEINNTKINNSTNIDKNINIKNVENINIKDCNHCNHKNKD